MKSHALSFVATLVLFLSANFVLAQEADKPTYKDGEWWKVKLERNLLEGVSSTNCQSRYSELMIKKENEKFNLYGVNGTNLELMECPVIVARFLGFVPEAQREDFERYSSTATQYELVQFPLNVGKHWNNKIKRVNRRGKVSWSDIDYKVLSWDKVQSAKGEIEAFKIQLTWMGNAGQNSQTYLYSPAIKGNVSFEIKTAESRLHYRHTLIDWKVLE